MAIGAIGGALANKENPLKGALLGGTIGAFTGGAGGAAAGAGAGAASGAGAGLLGGAGAGAAGGAASGIGAGAAAGGLGLTSGAGAGLAAMGGGTGLTMGAAPGLAAMGGGSGLTAGTGALTASSAAAPSMASVFGSGGNFDNVSKAMQLAGAMSPQGQEQQAQAVAPPQMSQAGTQSLVQLYEQGKNNAGAQSIAQREQDRMQRKSTMWG